LVEHTFLVGSVAITCLAVSLCTTRFNIQNFYMVPLCIECFVQISEQTVTFALYIINWLVFITVVESVYSALRP